MSQSLNVNGVIYAFPDVGEENWGQNVTNWSVAVTAGMLQKKGGPFTLTAEVDFGATYGLKTAYIKTQTADLSTVGVLRLANTDSIGWRNAANGADLELKPKVATDGILTYNGVDLVDISSAQTLTNKSFSGATLTSPVLGVATATSINGLTITPTTGGVLTIADNSSLITSGAYAITLTSTGATNVTLPTTGTLSTLAGAEALTNKTISAGSNTITGLVNANIDAAAAIAYSKLNLSGGIVNADVNASAAIAYSKLNLSASIVNADVNASAAIAYSKLNLSGSILNADINASAAIALSKLAALTFSRALVSDGSGFVSAATTTATEIGYVNGVTSSIQTQLDARVFKSTLTTKGDIYVATGASTVVRQGIGSDGQVMVADSSQTNGLKWANMPSGAKNYITYNNFENNATTGWTATGCATVTNGLPVTVGSGGAAFSSSNGGRTKGANTNSPAIDSGSSVSGVYALNLATTGAGVIGDGYISSAYAIDPSDRAKVLSWNLNFKVAAGTPVMGGTSTDTYAVAIYDPANNAWLPTTGAFSFNQISGVGKAAGTFQTNSTTTSVQIFIYSPVAPTGTSSLLIDDVFLGPQQLFYGPAITDWIAYTPVFTGLGTVSAVSGFWRRVGTNIEVKFKVTGGTHTAALVTITPPSGVHFALSGQNSVATVVGQLIANATPFGGVIIPGNDADKLYFAAEDSAYTSAELGTNWANGTVFGGNFSIPVLGWESNLQLSSDAETRIVAARYTTDTARAESTPCIFEDRVFDTHGAYNPATGVYTCPVAGKYRAKASMQTASQVWTAGNALNIIIQKDGANYSLGSQRAPGMTDQLELEHSAIIDCIAGTTIEFDFSSSGTATLSGSALSNYIEIERLSGPSVIASSESMMEIYETNAAQSIGSGGSPTIIDFEDRVKSSHGQVTTGASWKHTASLSGDYDVSAKVALSAITTFALNELFYIYIYKNGVAYSQEYFVFQGTPGGGSGEFSMSINDVVPLLAGEYVDIRVYQTSGGPIALASAAAFNRVNIGRRK